MKVHITLDRDVVGLGSTGRENDFFGGAINELGNLRTGSFDRRFRFPTIKVGSTVGITVLGDVVRKHGVKNPWVNRGGSLHV